MHRRKSNTKGGRNQAEMPEGSKQKNVISYQADGQRLSEPKCVAGTRLVNGEVKEYVVTGSHRSLSSFLRAVTFRNSISV